MDKIMRNMKMVIAAILVLFVAVVVFASVPEKETRSKEASRVVSDSTLVVPGVGAEGVVLGMTLKEIKELKGEPRRVTEKKRWKLFRDVFHLKEIADVPFDMMIEYGYPGITVGLKDSKVQFVIGQSQQRVTNSGVSLEKGVSYVIFQMGNEGLHILERTQKSLYMYRNRGVAFFDDGSNDSIDMYAVFNPSDVDDD